MRKWKRILTARVMVVGLIGVLFVSVPVTANSVPTVAIDAPAQVTPGSDFVARVNITSVTDFDAANYDVTYNSAVLQVIGSEGGASGVTAGLLNGTTVPVDMWGFVPSGTPGKIRVIQNVPGVAGVSGSGYLAEIYFHVIGASGTSSDITLSNGTLSDKNAQPIAANWVGDSVQVVSGDTTPPTVASTSPTNGDTGVAVGSNISATFSEAMNAATITASSFTLTVTGGAAVTGTVSYNATTLTATFDPTANLAYSTSYTATITTTVTDSAGNRLASAYSWSFTTAAAPGGVTVAIDAPAQVAPGSDFVARITITSVTNFDACNYDVTYNPAVLQVIGSEGGASGVTAGLLNGTAVPIDTWGFVPSGTPGKIRVTQNIPGVAGVSGAGYLAEIHFHVIGGSGTSNNITLSDGTLSDKNAQPIAATWVGDSVQVVSGDTTPPTAAITYSPAGPYKSGTSVTITATFSEAMADSPVPQIAISGANTLAATNMTKSSTTVYTYAYTVGAGNGTATVSLSTGTDIAGNVVTLAPTSGATFTADNTAPTISSTIPPTPANAATGVAVDSNTTITFSEAMDPATITTSSFTLTVTGGAAVTGTVSYNATTLTATFDPTANLAYSTSYTATITTTVTDLAGNHLASAYTWSFTTAPAPSPPAETPTPPAPTPPETPPGDVLATAPEATATDTEGNQLTLTAGVITVEEKEGILKVNIPVALQAGRTLGSFTDPNGITFSGNRLAIPIATAVGKYRNFSIVDEERDLMATITIETKDAIGTGTAAVAEVVSIKASARFSAKDFTAEDPSLGEVASTVGLDLNTLPKDAEVKITTTLKPAPEAERAFQLAATVAGMENIDTAYVINVTKTNLENVTDIKSATVTMKAGTEWVNTRGGVNAVKIFRYDPETETQEVLETHFLGYDEQGRAVFEGISPKGLSVFGLVGTPPQVAKFVISALRVTPEEVTVGETVNISILVANAGGQSGSYKVTLNINGEVVETREVTVSPDSSEKVNFSVSREVAGSYVVDINGVTGSFTVKEKPLPPAPPAAFSLGPLSILPTEVVVGEKVNISIPVANTGGQSGSYKVTLNINGEVVETREVTVSPDSSEKVNFGVSREVAGSYVVDINGVTGSFTVKEKPLPPAPPAAFSLGRLSISPAEAVVGEAVKISIPLTNTGGQPGTCEVVLKVNGMTEDVRTVTLAPGTTEQVSFTISKDTVGTFSVDVNDSSVVF